MIDRRVRKTIQKDASGLFQSTNKTNIVKTFRNVSTFVLRFELLEPQILITKMVFFFFFNILATCQILNDLC